MSFTTALAGGRRFWAVVLCFAIANIGVWIGYHRWQHNHRPPLLEVTRFLPGEGAVVDGKPTFRWVFNLDVAPAAGKNGPPGDITPPIAGSWTWPDHRTLQFVPDAPLPRAVPIQLSLHDDALTTSDGYRLAHPWSGNVKTPALAVLNVKQVGFDEDDRVILEIAFNDKVLPADVQTHLTLKGRNNAEIHSSPLNPAAGKTVRIKTDSMRPYFDAGEDLALQVGLRKGLAGEAGPLGLETDYRTSVAVADVVLTTEIGASFPSHGSPNIFLGFNSEVDLEEVRQVISVSPEIPFSVGTAYRGMRLYGAFAPGTRYSVKIASPPAGASSRSMPRATTLSVLIPDRAPGLWFEHDAGYLSAEGNRSVVGHAVNLTDLRATVTRMYDNNVLAWRNSSRRGGWWNVESFGRPVAVREIHLPTRKNQQQDIRLSLDDLLPAGEARDGVYQIRLQPMSTKIESAPVDGRDDEDDEYDSYGRYNSATATLTLSDIVLSVKQGRDALTVWATSLRRAKPVAGIRVRLFSSKSQLLGEAITESSGLASIVPLPCAMGEKPAVVIADEQASLEVRDGVPAADNAPADDARKASDASRAKAASARLTVGQGLTWLDLRDSTVSFGDADIGGRPYLRDGYEAFVYPDRGVYRPGETVHLRAILRGVDNAMPGRFPIRWQIRRPDLRNWKAQMTEIDADGAASFDVTLPNDLPSGRWTAHIGLPGDVGHSQHDFGVCGFDVEDFVPQRMKVAVEIAGSKAAGERVRLGDGKLTAEVQADYLFGRPAADRPATAVVRVEPSVFAPAGMGDWTFGDSGNASESLGAAKPLPHRAELPSVDLNDKGHGQWKFDIADILANGDAEQAAQPETDAPRNHPNRRRPNSSEPLDAYPGPWRVSLAASVTETGGRAVTAMRAFDVDAVPYYIGLKSRDTGHRPGVASGIDVQLVGCDGKASRLDASVKAQLFRETWNTSFIQENGSYRFQSTRVLEEVKTGGQRVKIKAGRGTINVTAPAGGSYVLVARDSKTNAFTSVSFYAAFGAWEDNISRQNPEKLELLVQGLADDTPEQAAAVLLEHRDPVAMLEQARRAALPPAPSGKLRIGQRARVIVRSPFAGQLLLTVENDGIINSQVLDMKSSHVAVDIDVTDACRPNAYVSATVIRAVDPNAAWAVHRAVGVVRIPVDNSDRKLTVQLAAPTEIRPQQSLGVQLRVVDAAGNVAPNAAVTVAAVDEGICRLTDFRTPDPFSFFMQNRALNVHLADAFGQLMPEAMRPGGHSATGGDDGVDSAMKRSSPVQSRRVKPVALVSAILHTDEQGIARADFAMPPFIGQVRLMAVASLDRSFGSSDAQVLVRSPLLVQSSWPRFAAPGDTFNVPLALFNNGSASGDVNVSVELVGDGPLKFASTNSRRLKLAPIRVSAAGQGQASIAIVALDRIGSARVRLTASLNGESFEEEVELPVRPPSPSIRVGGTIAASTTQPARLVIPADFIEGASRLDIRVGPEPQLQLPDGIDSLERYPYGCVEQTTSTLFPLAYLSDIGGKIAPGVFDHDRVADKIRVGMLRLLSMQTTDGGLAMWPGGQSAWPWASVYAAHFLVEAQAAGFDVPAELHDPLMVYVRNLLNQPEGGPEVLELQAYAAYVLALAGKPQRPAMARLSEVLKTESAGSAQFHLAAAWLAAGRKDIAAGIIPQEIPTFRTRRDLGGNVGSATRDRAILISTLLSVDATDPRIGPLVAQLAEEGRQGQWRSTQDIAMAVMAIGQYIRVAPAHKPYETAELFVDGKSAGSIASGNHLFWSAGSEASLSGQLHGMPKPGGAVELRITGPANAQAYVSWMQNGVPLKAPAGADHALTIRRRFLDESGAPLAINRVRSGDLVQVELNISADGERENLVIEDLLPAGLEIENPRLAGNATAMTSQKAKHRRRNSENEPTFVAVRTDMRDDRLVVLGHLTHAGQGSYIYTARAVTPGKFVLPPVRGECMYDSGINSLSGAGQFEVEAVSNARLVNAAP